MYEVKQQTPAVLKMQITSVKFSWIYAIQKINEGHFKRSCTHSGINTRVAIYISGLENKTNINYRKSLYYFSKYSPHYDLYTFACVWTNCTRRLNMHSERIDRFFRCRKTFTSYFFTYRNKKKPFSIKSGLYGGWLIKSMFLEFKNAVV